MDLKLRHLKSGSDVRGVAMDPQEGQTLELTPEAANKIGVAFSRWLKKKTGKDQLRVAVGRDSRLTGPDLLQAFALGLIIDGNIVLDTGLCTTPAMFMTTQDEELNCDAAAMITASHMPYNRNGIKMVTKEGGLAPSDVDDILADAETLEESFIPGGKREEINFLPTYAAGIVDNVRRLTGEEKPLEGAKIVVDAGNGAGGYFADLVLAPLGADTTGSQFLEPDGHFPNHIPNPEEAEAIEAIETAVRDNGADMGIIFDTDVDRSAIVDEKGHSINKSAFIAFIASQILEQFPGSTIVTDSVTSNGLTRFIEDRGGVHHRFKRGYKNVIDEAKRINAEGGESHLAMETSGHGAIQENYFLDDGSYLAMLSLVAFAKARKNGHTVSEFLKDYHYPAEELEVRYTIREDDFRGYGQKMLDAFRVYAEEHPGWTIVEPNYEGVRVNVDEDNGNGWILARMSLHEPVVPVNIESEEADGADRILAEFESFLKDYPSIVR